MLPTVTAPVVVALVVLTAIALLLVRTAAAPARWLALLATVAFGVVAGLAPRTELREVHPRARTAAVSVPGAAARTAMLAAAAGSGPRAVELQLEWREPEALPRAAPASAQPPEASPPETPAPEVSAARTSAPEGSALGAEAKMPPALPFAPEQVRLRAITALRVDRPATVEVAVASFRGRLPAEVVIVGPDGEELVRETVELGGQSAMAMVSFLPTRSGRHQVTLSVTVALGRLGVPHQVRAAGTLEVAPADELLCVEPSGVLAAALAAQGLRVRSLATWPADWRRHRRLVLGLALSSEQQTQLVAAVEDGLGLFVLPGAFGEPGDPLRALLPIVPRPVPPNAPGQGGGDGPGAGANDANDANDADARDPGEAGTPEKDPERQSEPEEPPPDEPPEEPPAESPNPGDEAERLGPISKDPIEVDKHAIAMVLLVDGSTSMNRMRGDFRKLHYAQESARRTAAALDVGDRVGIVSFGTRRASRIELPMTDAVRGAEIAAGIQRLTAYADSTWLLHGVQAARKLLQKESAAVKHVVVITDGMFMMRQTMALRKEAYDMRTRDKVTLSIISILDAVTEAGYKQSAQQIVIDGGGRFIASERIDQVPRIVSSEVQDALSRVGRTPRKPGGPQRADAPAAKDPPPVDPDRAEEPDPPAEPDPPKPPEASAAEEAPPLRLAVHAVAESRLLAPDPDTWPSLGEAVPNDARLDARVLLAVGDEGWPLLSFANRGLGRVAAFSAPLAGSVGREFREHPAFPGWLAQWLAATSGADEAIEPSDVREQGAVEPRAPLPDEVRWLTGVSGAEPLQSAVGLSRGEAGLSRGADGEPRDGGEALPAATVGREPVLQVARAAPWLLLVLLVLAIGERVTSWFTLRRGQG